MNLIKVKGLDSPVNIAGTTPTSQERENMMRAVGAKSKFTGMTAPAPAVPNLAVPNPAAPNPAVPNPAVPNPAAQNLAVPNPAPVPDRLTPPPITEPAPREFGKAHYIPSPVEMLPEPVSDALDQVGNTAASFLDPLDQGYLGAVKALPAFVDKQARETEAEHQEHRDQITAVMGDNYDPEGAMNNILLRADLVRSKTLAEIAAKFGSAYPDGTLRLIPIGGDGEYALMASPSPGVASVELDPPGADWPGSLGDVGGFLISEEMGGGIAGAILWGPVGAAIGAVTGKVTQYGVEAARGYLNRSSRDMVTDALISGAAFGVGEGMMRWGMPALGAGRRWTSERAGFPMWSEAAKRGGAAAYEEGLIPPSVGQVAKRPYVRAAYTQAGSTSPVLEATMTRQKTALRLSLEKRANKNGISSLSSEELDSLISIHQEGMSRILANVERGTLSRSEGYEQLQAGIKIWEKASRRLTDREYKYAFKLADDVTFELKAAQKKLSRIGIGVLSRAKLAARDVLNPVQGVRTTRASPDVPVIVTNLVNRFLALAPRVTNFSSKGESWTAFEQLKVIRTEAWDMMQSSDRQLARYGRKIWEELTKVMDNPVSANPEFKTAWNRASQLWKQREEILEFPFIARALNNKMLPEDFAKRFMYGGNYEKLLLIKKLSPLPQWEAYRSAFKFDLEAMALADNGGSALMARLRALEKDPESLALLLSREELRDFKIFARANIQEETSTFQAMSRQQLSTGEQALQLANVTEAEAIMAVANTGGMDGSFAVAARASLYTRILNEVREITITGVQTLNPTKLLANIRKERENESLAAFMRPQDWRALENYEVYTGLLTATSDVGGMMQRGSIVSQMTNFFNPLGQLHAARQITKNEVTARILAQPAAYNKYPEASATLTEKLRGAGGALGVIHQDMGNVVQIMPPDKTEQ